MPIIPEVPLNQPPLGVPRYPSNGIAEGFFKAFGALGEVAAEMRKRDEALWFSQAQADFITKSNELKDSVQESESDPNKRVQQYQKQQAELQANILKSAPTRSAAIQAQDHFAKLGATDFVNYQIQQAKQWNDTQLASLDEQGRFYASLIAKTPDEESKKLLARTYEGLSLGMTAGRHPAQTMDQHTKRMLAFKSQTEELRLNQMDPDLALADLQNNKSIDNGLDPNRVPILKRSFVEAAEHKDLVAERHQRAGQHAAFVVGANLADQGQINADTVNRWELDGTINPAQANDLRGRVGKPGMALAPGVAQDYLSDVVASNWNPAAIQKAQTGLRGALAAHPKDPSITSALNVLDVRVRMMSDRAHTDRARAAQEKLLEFDTGLAARYRTYGSYFREKFDQAKDALHLEILQGKDPAQALKDANAKFSGGDKPADADARDQLNLDAGR